MATEKILQTRIQLKYDTWNNWNTTAAKSLVLKQGELATVYVPADTLSGQTTSEPAFLLKVGDGTTKFENLPWLQAKAADVYEWAKAATKPTYTAAEISGLDDYISGKVQDTNTKYQIVQDETDGHIIRLQKKDLGEAAWTTVDTITIPDNDTKYTLVTGTANGTIKFNGAEVAVAGLKSAAYQESAAFDSAGSASAVLGKESDNAGAATVYGANKAASNAQKTADAAMPKSGGTFSGQVTLPAPSGENNAARKTDVDTALQDAKDYIDTKTAGLTGAMHFVGKSTTDPTSTTGPTVDGKAYSGKSGDVVLWNTKEFVYNGTTWTELGDEGSHVLNTQTINGHALTGNIELTASDVGADAAGTAAGLVNALDVAAVGGTGKYITTVSQADGKVAAVAATMPTTLKNPKALTFGTKSYDGSASQTITLADIGGATSADITNAINALDVAKIGGGENEVITSVTQVDGKISATTKTVETITPADIAMSGSVADLVQPDNVILVFDCGTSSTVI